jgi:hypothetical protein
LLFSCLLSCLSPLSLSVYTHAHACMQAYLLTLISNIKKRHIIFSYPFSCYSKICVCSLYLDMSTSNPPLPCLVVCLVGWLVVLGFELRALSFLGNLYLLRQTPAPLSF